MYEYKPSGVSKDSLSAVSTVGGDHQSLHTQSNKQFLESRVSTFNLHKFYKHSVKSMAHFQRSTKHPQGVHPISKGLQSIHKEYKMSTKHPQGVHPKASTRSTSNLQKSAKHPQGVHPKSSATKAKVYTTWLLLVFFLFPPRPAVVVFPSSSLDPLEVKAALMEPSARAGECRPSEVKGVDSSVELGAAAGSLLASEVLWEESCWAGSTSTMTSWVSPIKSCTAHRQC